MSFDRFLLPRVSGCAASHCMPVNSWHRQIVGYLHCFWSFTNISNAALKFLKIFASLPPLDKFLEVLFAGSEAFASLPSLMAYLSRILGSI